MPRKSSVAGRVYIGLFMGVICPTLAFVIQQAWRPPLPQVTVSVHPTVPPTGGTGSEPKPDPETKPTTPTQKTEPEPATRPEKKPEPEPKPTMWTEPDKGGPKPLASDLSQDVTGTWTGGWRDSEGGAARDTLIVQEHPDGRIVGLWCKDFRLQKGKRISQDGIQFCCDGYEVTGKLKDKGRRLILLYTYATMDKGRPVAIVGFHRMVRDVADHYSTPAPADLSGHWVGKFANTLGEAGDLELYLTDRGDGRLEVKEDRRRLVCEGQKLNGKVRWQTTYGKGVLTVEGDYEPHMLRLSYGVTYPPGSKLKGFTGHSWYVRD
jgi:hypothetical protein